MRVIYVPVVTDFIPIGLVERLTAQSCTAPGASMPTGCIAEKSKWESLVCAPLLSTVKLIAANIIMFTQPSFHMADLRTSEIFTISSSSNLSGISSTML